MHIANTDVRATSVLQITRSKTDLGRFCALPLRNKMIGTPPPRYITVISIMPDYSEELKLRNLCFNNTLHKRAKNITLKVRPHGRHKLKAIMIGSVGMIIYTGV